MKRYFDQSLYSTSNASSSQAWAKLVRPTLSPWSLKKEEAEGASVMVNFWPALRSRHVSHVIRNSQRLTIGYAKQIFFLRTHPTIIEDTPPSEESTAPRTLLLPKASPPRDSSFPSRARRSQQMTSLISAYIHGICYAVRSSHISNIATTPTSVQIVTKSSRNHSRHQGYNPSRCEGIIMCRSYDHWNLRDPHGQWRLLEYIYTRRSMKKETQTNHQHLPRKKEKKERDQTLRIQRILLLKPLSHCNLRLEQSSNSL